MQTSGRISVKECFLTIGSFLLALALLVLEALFWLVFGLPYRLWKKWNYEAQCLRYPGGGWGHNMAQTGKDRQDRPDKPDRR